MSEPLEMGYEWRLIKGCGFIDFGVNSFFISKFVVDNDRCIANSLRINNLAWLFFFRLIVLNFSGVSRHLMEKLLHLRLKTLFFLAACRIKRIRSYFILSGTLAPKDAIVDLIICIGVLILLRPNNLFKILRATYSET